MFRAPCCDFPEIVLGFLVWFGFLVVWGFRKFRPWASSTVRGLETECRASGRVQEQLLWSQGFAFRAKVKQLQCLVFSGLEYPSIIFLWGQEK